VRRERGVDPPPRSDGLIEGLFPSAPIIILSAAGSVNIEKLFICMTIFLEGAEMK